MGTKTPCAHCGEKHHHFANCRDGYRVKKFDQPKFGVDKSPYDGDSKGKGPQVTASAPPAAEESAPPPPPSPLSQARQDLIAMIESLPADSPQRASLQLMLERDQARTEHDAAEQRLQQTSGNKEAKLPLPTILRDYSEEKGRFLETELARTLASAGRSMPPMEEVVAVKTALNGIQERNEQKAVEEIMRTKPLPGATHWICRNTPACGERFQAATMEEVRRYAKENPTWRFVCPTCKSVRVELIQLSVVA